MKNIFSIIIWISSFVLIGENWGHVKPSFLKDKPNIESKETTNTVATNSGADKNVRSKYYSSLVNSLRIREEPKLDAKVIGVLEENDKVRYLNEKTNWNEIVEIRGVKKSEPWLKVKDENKNIVGWVYGGAVRLSNTTSSNDKVNFITTVHQFIKAEDNRDANKMYNLFSDNAISYWGFDEPKNVIKLHKHLKEVWSKTQYSKNTILNTYPKGNTVEVSTRFEYMTSNSSKPEIIDNTVYFDLDKNGKILKVYGE